MAQASSAQREPSMEEILSSIRRIIEDGDSGDKAPAAPLTEAAPAPKPMAEAVPADLKAPEPAAEAQPETLEPAVVETMAEPPKAEIPAVPPRMERAPVQPTSLEQIRSQIAAGRDEEDDELETVLKEMTPAAEIVDDEDDDIAIFAEAEAKDNGNVPETSPEEDWEAEFSADGSAAELEDAVSDAAIEAVASAVPAQSGPILSPETERQVAASFEELSKAFISSRAESYDKMAENLMRPMLQEWLDNNLPTLVEKLVREEIERVARGGSK